MFVISEFKRAVAVGDSVEAERMFFTHVLEIAYSLRADNMRDLLQKFVESGADSTGAARGMLTFFSSGDLEALKPLKHSLTPLINGVPTSALFRLGEAVNLRFQGDVLGSLALLEGLGTQLGPSRVAFDTHSGWGLMFSVQSGTTAMLAGDIRRALVELTAATLHPLVPGLSFLTREAQVKLALIQGTFGDDEAARRLLQQSQGLRVSGNWVDDRSDTTSQIVRALIEFEDPARAKQLIDSVELHEVGELWPYYVLALHRVYDRSGHRDDLGLKFEVFERMPLPRRIGEGLTGSVLATARATLAIEQQRVSVARNELSAADQRLIGVRAVRAFAALAGGNAEETVLLTHGLSQDTQGLRQIELWRLALLAAGYLELEDSIRALGAMQLALALPGGLRPHEARWFTPRLQQLAAEKLSGWPLSPSTPSPRLPTSALSRREVEVLRLLGSPLKRADIADNLYISDNTLKRHLSNIYRKLGAHSRESAVQAAVLRGIM